MNVRTGESVYFDNHRTTIVPRHVMANLRALPPGFPPVTIDGEMCLDSGIASNSPLAYVLEQDFRLRGADLGSTCSAARANYTAEPPAGTRAPDIRYANKRR